MSYLGWWCAVECDDDGDGHMCGAHPLGAALRRSPGFPPLPRGAAVVVPALSLLPPAGLVSSPACCCACPAGCSAAEQSAAAQQVQRQSSQSRMFSAGAPRSAAAERFRLSVSVGHPNTHSRCCRQPTGREQQPSSQ